MPNDTICTKPWMLLSVGSTGNLRPCCNATNASIRDFSGAISKIANKTDYSLEGLMNDHTHRELRESMLNGERHPICDRCWKMEDSGVESFRQMSNNSFPETANYIRETKSIEPVAIKRIEFDLGRKCNLRCRMCAPWSSTLISKEGALHPESTEYYGRYHDTEDWVDVVDIKELISPHLQTIREIYLIGGEPLIIDVHEELLDYLVNSGVSGQITLIYNTNGITIKTKFIEHWKKFQSVQLNVSIDGIYEYYNYIRNPAKWETLDANIDRLLEETKNARNVSIGISSTLQNLTVPAMLSLFRWAETKNIYVQVHSVEFPEFLQPDVMPAGDYNKYLKELKENVDMLRLNNGSLKQIIAFMDANTKNLANVDLQKTFVHKQKLLDKIRDQDLFETHQWAKNI